MFNPQIAKTLETLFCQGCSQAFPSVICMDAHRLNVTRLGIIFFDPAHAVGDALPLGIYNHQIQFRLIGRRTLKRTQAGLRIGRIVKGIVHQLDPAFVIPIFGKGQ